MRYRFKSAIFASAPLDKRDWRWHLTSAFLQRLRKYTFKAVHTKTHRRRFQIHPLWRAFSNLCVYGERFHCLRVVGRPKCIKKFAFASVCRLQSSSCWRGLIVIRLSSWNSNHSDFEDLFHIWSMVLRKQKINTKLREWGHWSSIEIWYW